jgi:hypothetical protein
LSLSRPVGPSSRKSSEMPSRAPGGVESGVIGSPPSEYGQLANILNERFVDLSRPEPPKRRSAHMRLLRRSSTTLSPNSLIARLRRFGHALIGGPKLANLAESSGPNRKGAPQRPRAREGTASLVLRGNAPRVRLWYSVVTCRSNPTLRHREHADRGVPAIAHSRSAPCSWAGSLGLP